MNVTLWTLQVAMGAFFIVSGYGKAFKSWEELQRIPWIDGVKHPLMIFIGWCEMLGGIGLILPAIIRVKPVLTPIAAACLMLIMILATGFHAMRGEYLLMMITIVLGCVAGFVAYGRFALRPIKRP